MINIELKNARKCTYPGVKKDYYLITEDGKVYSLVSNRYLTPKLSKDGYYEIALQSNKSSSRHVYVRIHRLVAYQFVPNPNNYPVVDHINAKKTDNYYKNLEWVTVLENTRRAATMGLINGIQRPRELVITICELFEQGYTTLEVFYNITTRGTRIEDDSSLYRFIESIRYRKIWSDVTKNYTFTEESTSKKSKKSVHFDPSRKGNYDEKIIREICEMLQNRKSPKEILLYYMPHVQNTKEKEARKLYCFISNIKQRKIWDYITKDYYWENEDRCSINDDIIYKYFCDGMNRDEVKRMIGLKNSKDDRELYQRMQNCYHKYRKIHEMSGTENIIIRQDI